MRLITWNCQGAFRKKLNSILAYKPDILVVPESEHPDKLNLDSAQKPNSFYWHGDNPHKGIGIYSYTDYKFELLPSFNPEFRYILPFLVTGKGQTFTLFAIWAMNNKENYDQRYIGQIWLAIDYYSKLLTNSLILVGDFNSNKIWDHKGRVGNHSDVVSKLLTHNIHSIYHSYFKFEQGKDDHPTFFLQRNKNKPYHIDYCFASIEFMNKVQKVEIGTYENWIGLSDHSPLIIDFDDFDKK